MIGGPGAAHALAEVSCLGIAAQGLSANPVESDDLWLGGLG